MNETPQFLPEVVQQEEATRDQLAKEGGILFREEPAEDETGESKRFINILGVEIETQATAEDVAWLTDPSRLNLESDLDRTLLREIAETYQLHQPLMIEGRPGAGKTHLLKKFVQLVHGREAPILELVGTPRTSELEILGHWAPSSDTKDSEDPAARDAMARYATIETAYREANDTFDRQYQEAKSSFNQGDIQKEAFDSYLKELTAWYHPLQERYATELQLLMARSSGHAEWEFKQGALLQAYSGNEGKGRMLIVDEFNLIPANSQQIFLEISGERGHLSDSVSFFGNSGKTRYERGDDTWVAFAANFPETTPGRSEVTAPMTNRLVWRVITDKEAEVKEDTLLDSALGELRVERQPLDRDAITMSATEPLNSETLLGGELGPVVASTVKLLHKEAIKTYQELGDFLLIRGEKRRRTQLIEFSVRTAGQFYDCLKKFQIRDQETGRIDVAESIRRGFNRYYIEKVADDNLRQRLEALATEVLEGDTGKIEFEGTPTSREDVLKTLVNRLAGPETQRSIAPDETEHHRRQLQIFYDIADRMGTTIDNPNIPPHIREAISGLKQKIETADHVQALKQKAEPSAGE